MIARIGDLNPDFGDAAGDEQIIIIKHRDFEAEGDLQIYAYAQEGVPYMLGKDFQKDRYSVILANPETGEDVPIIFIKVSERSDGERRENNSEDVDVMVGLLVRASDDIPEFKEDYAQVIERIIKAAREVIKANANKPNPPNENDAGPP